MRLHRTMPAAFGLALTLAACSTDNSTVASPPTDGGDVSSAVSIVASGTAFDQSSLRAGAGPYEIRLDNQDAGTPHNIHVTGEGVDDKTDIEDGPVTQTLTVTLSAGTYRYQCDVHPEQMKGTITVS